MKNYGFTILKDVADLDFDLLVDELDDFLVAADLGATYAADSFGDDRLVICFNLTGEVDGSLSKLGKFTDRCPKLWEAQIVPLR
ncbi:hypothetical protein ACFQY0_21055 [Haloferula chungangensis]|uniref:Uncharacterized protein n=1 Tax=Haloferula chungangensis TaxID=1048331 RepID=A0ABW2LB70_9BACT